MGAAMIPRRALEAEILPLHAAEDWPVGTIATQLRVHHSTVRRVLAQAGVPTSKPVRASMVEPYLDFIADTFAKYPTAKALLPRAMSRLDINQAALDLNRPLSGGMSM